MLYTERMAETPLTKLLHHEFLAWERSTGKRQSLLNYARWLGLKQSTLSTVMNGNSSPTIETLQILARRLGPRVYLAVGIEPPGMADDDDLRFILANWGRLPPEVQSKILEIMRERVERRRGGSADADITDPQRDEQAEAMQDGQRAFGGLAATERR